MSINYPHSIHAEQRSRAGDIIVGQWGVEREEVRLRCQCRLRGRKASLKGLTFKLQHQSPH